MILADLLNFQSLVPFAVFGAIAIGAWWLLDTFGRSSARTMQRLDELRDPSLRKKEAAAAAVGKKKGDAMSRVIEKASPALAKPLQPKSDLEASKLKMKLNNAGFRSEAAPTVFLGLKFLGLVVGLFLSGATMVAISDFSQRATMSALFLAGGLFYLPDLVLKFLISRRQEAIFLGLPDALDLMVVCVEAGLGLDQAMRKVAEEMKKIYPVIADEFSVANFQLQVGRTRTEVLHELGVRTGVDDVRSLAAILIQADKFGSSIAQALRVQAIRCERAVANWLRKKAAKTAVKLIFPLVIFIFPGIFVVLVGPAAITMIREMFPMMNSN